MHSEGILDVMDSPLELVDPRIPLLDALVVVSLDLFDLILILQSFLFAQLVEPFGFDKGMQFLG